MKVLKLNLIALTFAINIVSCNKESLTEIQEPQNERVHFVLDNVQKIANPNDVSIYTKNVEDADDEKINKQLLEITIATRDFLKETPQNQNILKSAKLSGSSSINLFDLVASSRLKSSKQNAAYTNLVSLLEKANLTHASKNSLKSSVTEEYVPAIYVPNAEIADLSKQPLVGVGFEVNDDLQGMEEYEDYIVAWYYDEDGNLHEILINEETAMNTTNPVFIVIADSEKDETNSKNSILESKHTKSATSTSSVKKIIDEYKINYRYDKSKRSEYSYEIAYIYNNGGLQFGGYRTEIAEIHKDDIGKVLTNDFEIWQINNINDLRRVVIVTFEYDWYASKKTVLYGDPAFGTIIFECRMSKSDEYYQLFSILMTDDITSNYDKGYIKVKTQ